MIAYHKGCKIVILGLGNWLEERPDPKLPPAARAEAMRDLFVRYTTFLQENHCGGFALTIAAQSLRCFRHRHKKSRIHIHGNAAVYQLENASLRGGRESLFYFGRTDERLHIVDVQSMYGCAMQAGVFPAVIRGYAKDARDGRFDELLAKGEGIARVRLRTRGNEYPCKDHGVLDYREGEFVTVLAGPELRRAWTEGEVVHVGETAVFHCVRLFADYVRFWWHRRLAAFARGDTPAQSVAKAMLTRLWGKLSQKRVEWRPSRGQSPMEGHDYWVESFPGADEIYAMRENAGQVEREYRGLATWDSFPAIGAYVCSYARLQMDYFRRIAGPRNVYLQFVDMLGVNDRGLANLRAADCIRDGRLGALRICGTYNGGQFYAPTDYTLEGQRKICGIPVAAIEVSPGRFKFWISENRPDRESTTGQCCGSLREVEIVLKRPRPPGFVRVDDWLVPVPYHEKG